MIRQRGECRLCMSTNINAFCSFQSSTTPYSTLPLYGSTLKVLYNKTEISQRDDNMTFIYYISWQFIYYISWQWYRRKKVTSRIRLLTCMGRLLLLVWSMSNRRLALGFGMPHVGPHQSLAFRFNQIFTFQ